MRSYQIWLANVTSADKELASHNIHTTGRSALKHNVDMPLCGEDYRYFLVHCGKQIATFTPVNPNYISLLVHVPCSIYCHRVILFLWDGIATSPWNSSWFYTTRWDFINQTNSWFPLLGSFSRWTFGTRVTAIAPIASATITFSWGCTPPWSLVIHSRISTSFQLRWCRSTWSNWSRHSIADKNPLSPLSTYYVAS